MIYLEDLARSRDSDSSERSGKSTESSAKIKEDMPALLSRPENFNPFTPKT